MNNNKRYALYNLGENFVILDYSTNTRSPVCRAEDLRAQLSRVYHHRPNDLNYNAFDFLISFDTIEEIQTKYPEWLL